MANYLSKSKYIMMEFSSEDSFTAYTNMYISQNYECLRDLYFHVPNERAGAEGMRRKLFSMGLLPGVMDFCFIEPTLWFIELKMPKGVLSPAQEKLIRKWTEKGIEIYVCRNAADVCKVLESKFGNPKFVT